MIAWVSGEARTGRDYVVVVTTNGVGYKVFVGPRQLARAQNGQAVSYHTYPYIREDRFELYGFASAQDLQLFELLLGVSGCGPKMALALADAGAAPLIEAVQQAEVSYFTQFPRVGKKLAQKLIIELKNKLGGVAELDLSPKSQTYEEVMAGLQTLGFGEAQIRQALKDIDLDGLDTATALKQCLQKIKN